MSNPLDAVLDTPASLHLRSLLDNYVVVFTQDPSLANPGLYGFAIGVYEATLATDPEHALVELIRVIDLLPEEYNFDIVQHVMAPHLRPATVPETMRLLETDLPGMLDATVFAAVFYDRVTTPKLRRTRQSPASASVARAQYLAARVAHHLTSDTTQRLALALALAPTWVGTLEELLETVATLTDERADRAPTPLQALVVS